MRRRLVTALAAAAVLLALVAAPAGARSVPYFKHVFIVVLENENASSTFGKNSEAPYLAHTLKRRGAYVPNYYGIGHFSLTNYIPMVSGQAPNPET
jgi:hypothetical protein